MEKFISDIPVSTYKPKNLKPVIKILKNGTEITDYTSFDINRSVNDITQKFNINFIGQTHYNDLNSFNAGRSEFEIYTGYKIDGNVNGNTVIKGYADRDNFTLSPDGLKTTGNFINGIITLLPPYASKITVDVRVINTQKKQLSYIDFDDPAITSASQLVGQILSGTGIGLRYACYDYPIANYHAEDYPIAVIKDLIEFVGGYLHYNAEENTLECLEKYVTNVGGVDFLYTDYNDIYEITEAGQGNNEFYNAVRVFGVSPNENIEMFELDEIDQIGQALADDDQMYLVDTISGTEPAPEEPYCDEPPKEKIEKKFYNVYLGFDIDPDSIKIEGGSWNEETNKFEGAELLGYGTGFSSVESLSSDDGDLPMPEDLAPGEGKVSFPWAYEENPDKEAISEFGLTAGVYSEVTIKGLVKDENTGNPIPSAKVTLDFEGTGQTWQWWKHTASNAILRFYLSGSPELGEGWVDITGEYEQLPEPEGFPKEMATGTGATTDEETGAGIFSFTHCPISLYTATAEAIGYNDNDLLIEFATDSFDFLTSGNPGDDKNKKYKIIDTAYHVAIWAKKAPPMVSGNPEEEPTDEDIPEQEIDQISVEVRCSDGLTLTGGQLIYAPDITDSRIISEDMAIHVGRALLYSYLASRRQRTFRASHNPWLEEGNRIAIKSKLKGWNTPKEFIVQTIDTDYSVNGSDEEIKDTITVVDVSG